MLPAAVVPSLSGSVSTLTHPSGSGLLPSFSQENIILNLWFLTLTPTPYPIRSLEGFISDDALQKSSSMTTEPWEGFGYLWWVEVADQRFWDLLRICAHVLPILLQSSPSSTLCFFSFKVLLLSNCVSVTFVSPSFLGLVGIGPSIPQFHNCTGSEPRVISTELGSPKRQQGAPKRGMTLGGEEAGYRLVPCGRCYRSWTLESL